LEGQLDQAELAYPNLSPRMHISGYAYDLETGLLTEVVAAHARAKGDSKTGG
jgi:hypothetical protein